MTTVLVANRGEIARRVFRTARRMGWATVAVFSDADAEMPFVREADRAIRIGPPEASASYLDVARVVAAAREAGADVVHPGYGFLAEDPRLARALAEAGIRFAGPPPEVLAALGDKARAKEIAERAGVPLLPDTRGKDGDDAALMKAARRIGYPVMVKPVAGGGGIGMRLVNAEPELADALAAARRQSRAAFGDERVFVERAVTRPRHVEVQVLADTHGSVIALGERDCSAQRRHQKVIEECPSPAVDPPLRSRLEAAAIAIAREAGYVGAGTVEFLLDERGEHFFIEVNARLQVEHPVTEAVHGIDLVEQQLRIALGEPLAAPRGASGHAIELRVYAEDPAQGFAPSTGHALLARWPAGVRVDAAIETGSLVTRHYDPLLAKIIVHAADRDAALEQAATALAGTTILGLRTNVAFLRALLAHPQVRAGRIDTTLIDRDLAALAPPAPEPPPAALALAAAAVLDDRRAIADPRDPWTALGAWRPGSDPAAVVTVGEAAVRVSGNGPYAVDGLRLEHAAGPGAWTVDGAPAFAARDRRAVWIGLDGATFEIALDPPLRGVDALAAADVIAPMPGIVLSVAVADGQRVAPGDLIAVVEAMKMEMRVVAPKAGVVGAVLCAPGQQVERGQRLVELAAAE